VEQEYIEGFGTQMDCSLQGNRASETQSQFRFQKRGATARFIGRTKSLVQQWDIISISR
jgi:hypothetical protein